MESHSSYHKLKECLKKKLYSIYRSDASQAEYSLRPFHKTKSIFIHIPKCAGVSVNTYLYGNLAGGHASLSDYEKNFTPDELMNYFKFTVVRNPWDRLVSAYNFLMDGGMNDFDKEWATKNIFQYPDFQTFVHEWLNEENIQTYYHFMPQYKFMTSSNKNINIDFYAFLENFDDDFQYIVTRLGKKGLPKRRNQGRTVNYGSYYDEKTKEIVASVYKKDIELLGYDFTNSNLPKQLQDRNSKNFPYTH